MRFTERETQSLLDTDPDYRIRRTFLSRCNWKSIVLAFCAGLVPVLLWLAIFQNYDETIQPEAPPLLQLQQPSQLPSAKTQSLLLLAPTQPPPQTINGNNILKEPISPPKNILTASGSPYKKSPSKSSSSKKPTGSGTNLNPMYSTVGNKTIVTYNLIVTEGLITPDNFLQPAYLINGQSPGPEIRVPQYSILIVHVTNKLKSPLTFHFHGIHQRKSFLADGVPHVTQKPIPPGGTYTHEINTWPQVGTFFYHAHTGMDIVWLFGPLVIEDDPVVYPTLPAAYQYDEDRVFILNGIYHDSLDQLIERIAGPVHLYPTIISSVTINGRSFGLWENETEIHDNTGYDVTPVQKGLRYRFRFINAASDSLLSCNISNHKFSIIEMDGIYTHPVETDHLVISPGQRYSLIILMDQDIGNYYISCKHMESNGPRNGLAILNYQGAPTPSDDLKKLHRPGMEVLELDRWVVDQLTPDYVLNQTDVYKVPVDIDKEYVIDVFEAVVGERHVYLLNGHYFEDPTVPYFMQVKSGVNISDPPQVYEVIEGEVVQFVFQNQRTGDFCFSHPWHIHGHSFYVVGEGPDRYDPIKDGEKIQKDVESGKSFQFRDSVTVYGNQTVGENTDGAFCGWAAVRFSAHNPGIWLAHCHVTPHMIMGKKFVIWEHSEEDPTLSALMNIKIRG